MGLKTPEPGYHSGRYPPCLVVDILSMFGGKHPGFPFVLTQPLRLPWSSQTIGASSERPYQDRGLTSQAPSNWGGWVVIRLFSKQKECLTTSSPSLV